MKRPKRIVIKVGSSSLASVSGGISAAAIDQIAEAAAYYHQRQVQIVLVSSGAIAAGLAPLGWKERPTDLSMQQAAASVGQGILLAEYSRAFTQYDIICSQVLLTNGDFMRRTHFTNALNALERLLSCRVLPIVNENDTVVTDEIRFGDNDRLAMLLARMVNADELFLLSDVRCVYGAPPDDGGQPIPVIANPEQAAAIKTASSAPLSQRIGSGGMASKIKSAAIAASNGIKTTITKSTLIFPALQQSLEAAEKPHSPIGTVFMPWGKRYPLKTVWLEHVARSEGTIIVDDGAKKAITRRHASLLLPGIVKVDGGFEARDVVNIQDAAGKVIARGVAKYSAQEISSGLARGEPAFDVVIHTDNMVIV